MISRGAWVSMRYGCYVTFVANAALLLVISVYSWPTSDYRARLYWLLDGGPQELILPMVAIFVFVGLLGVWISGWLNTPALVGVLAGALTSVALLYSGFLGHLLWQREYQVTPAGKYLRVAVAVATTVAVVVWAKRRRMRPAA